MRTNKSRARRIYPRMVEIVMVLLLSLTAMNCWKDPMTPVAPTWDVNLTFPVASKNITLGDVLEKDSSSLSADAQNRLVFSSSMEATPVALGDQLAITPASSNAAIKLGTFLVDIAPVTMNMVPEGVTPGATTPVPPGDVFLPDQQASVISSGSVTFASGTISLTVQNNMPIDIVARQPIILLDPSGTEVARFDLGSQPIGPGQHAVGYSDLADVSLGTSVNITGLVFTTPGSSGDVTFPGDSLVVVVVAFANARATSAQLPSLPAQRLVDNDTTSIMLDDSTMVKLAGMRSGSLHFAFHNRINAAVRLRFRVNNLWKSTGGAMTLYEDSLSLGAQSTGSYTMDLTGCELQSAPGELLNMLDLTSSVIIPSTVTSSVAIHDTDKVQIVMSSGSPIMVDTLSGALKPTWVNVNTAVGIDHGTFPSKLKGTFVIPSASLVFNVLSGVGYPADLYVSLSAVRRDGQTAIIPVPSNQRRIEPGITTISFDPSDVGRFLSQFSDGLPDSLYISGKVLVNPPDCYTTDPLRVGGASSTCSIGGTVTLAVPMTVGIAQASYRDTVDFGVDDDGSNKKPAADQLNNVNTAKLHLDVQNGVPAQVGVTIHLLDAQHHLILTLPQTGGPMVVSAAAVDAQGFASAPATTNLVIDLNHDEAQLYNAAEYVDYEVSVVTPQGAPASFRTSDAVHVRVWTECSMGVNK
jgi:hypothetical protein